MKKILVVILCISNIQSQSSELKWDGEAGDGLWNTASNWTGNTLPTAADDVVLDNTFVSGSYTVNLPAGNTSIAINSLLIDPGIGNTILLFLPATNTADPGLGILGSGDALIMNDRALLKNSSRASTGTGLSITGTFRINNGGHYIHNTSRGNASIVSQLSAAAGTESGIFEYDVPVASYTVSLSGRIYGTLILSSVTRGSTVSYTGSGASPLRINGDLEIRSAVNFNMNMTGNCIVNGNFKQQTGSVLNIQTSNGNNLVQMRGNIISSGTITETGNGLPVLEMSGIASQEITVTGQFLNTITVRINNSAGIRLLAPFTIPYNLQFIKGNIHSTNANPLTMIDNAVCTGASSLGFVEGPVNKIGDEDFNFPVGKGGIYSPLGLIAVSGASVTDRFTAEYIRANPQSSYGINYLNTGSAMDIDHISYVEYWKMSSNTNATKIISLPINCESFCKDSGSLLIARHTGGQWQGFDKRSTTGSFSCPLYFNGTITAGPLSEFTEFTLASSAPGATNPLPLKLLSFDVRKESGERSLISWQLAEPTSAATKFTIERSGDDGYFAGIATLAGQSGRENYQVGSPLAPGNSRFRLKIIDDKGLVSYSRIVYIRNGISNLRLESLYPGIVSSKLAVSVVSAKEQELELLLMDMSGRVVERQHQRLQTGKTLVILSLNQYAAGIYQVCGKSKEGMTNVLRFTKK